MNNNNENANANSENQSSVPERKKAIMALISLQMLMRILCKDPIGILLAMMGLVEAIKIVLEKIGDTSDLMPDEIESVNKARAIVEDPKSFF